MSEFLQKMGQPPSCSTNQTGSTQAGESLPLVSERHAERYREVEVAGSYHAMGRQIGEAAREELRGFVATSYDRIAQTLRLTPAGILDIARQSAIFVENYAPEFLAELRGMSEASGVEFDDLMFLQIRNQLTTDRDQGCTSFSAGRTITEDGTPLIGQNWDNDPALDPFTIVLSRHPENSPSFLTVTQAGLIAYIGFNDAGMAACLNTLPAPSRPVGVPHYFTLRRIFESRSLETAVEAVAAAHRAIPANIMLGTPEGPADLEVTPDSVHVLRPDAHELLIHTNHCLHPELLAVNSQFAELIQSGPRLCRMQQLITTDEQRLSLEMLKTALRDHHDFPKSLCRHANDDPQHGCWETVFSVIMAPQSRAMHLTRGQPCTAEYATYIMR